MLGVKRDYNEIAKICDKVYDELGAGLRIAAARLRFSEKPAVSYELAMPKGKKPEELEKPGVWTFFGVDTGLGCFANAYDF